jgi:putative tricarboxylic transport membrane protein
VAGVVMLGFGLLMLGQALDIKATGDLISGPRLFPLVITVAWTVLSACYLGQQLLLMARRRTTMPVEPFAHLLRVLGVLTVLVAYAFALEPVGYLISTFVLFVAVAALLGSHHWPRDVVVGIGLSLGIYLVFTQLLAVRLPSGVLG